MQQALITFGVILSLCSPAWGDDWLFYGGDQGGSHYSSLAQINRSNVHRLRQAWSYRTGALDRHPDRKAFASFHATPILLPEPAGESQSAVPAAM